MQIKTIQTLVLLSVAAGLVSCGGTSGNNQTAPTDPPSHKVEIASVGMPGWLRIRKGQLVYTGYDGGDTTTVSICASHSAYNDNASGGTTKCTNRKAGIPARIVSWDDDFTLDGKTNFPVVKIIASDGSWSGYTGSLLQIQPRIPPGTQLYTRNGYNGANVHLRLSPTNDLFSGPEIKNHTSLRLVRQIATEVQNYNLLVRIMDGPYAGKTCWVLSTEVETPDRSELTMRP